MKRSVEQEDEERAEEGNAEPEQRRGKKDGQQPVGAPVERVRNCAREAHASPAMMCRASFGQCRMILSPSANFPSEEGTVTLIVSPPGGAGVEAGDGALVVGRNDLHWRIGGRRDAFSLPRRMPIFSGRRLVHFAGPPADFEKAGLRTFEEPTKSATNLVLGRS